jgi:hypothetical protein
MLWSEYKLPTIRCTEFLRKQITGIPNFANRNSNFLTLQTSKFKKRKTNRNLWNQKRNRNSAYNGGPRNWNQKSEFPTKVRGEGEDYSVQINSHFGIAVFNNQQMLQATMEAGRG